MTISSMTGYAVASRESAQGTITIELKSVNSRFLDLQFRMNDELRALEPMLRETLTQGISRGKVECRVSFGRRIEGSGQGLNQAMLKSLSQMQEEVKKTFPAAPALTVSEVLRWPGVIEEAQSSQESLQAEAAAVLNEVLKAFTGTRQREGAALQAMLLSRVEEMEKIVERITPLMPQAVANFQQKATERMREALGQVQGTVLDEAMERVRQEVTLYGVRLDVAEELTRLSAHLKETRAVLAKGGQVGKRLDFMMQELNREANTLGSKAALKELSDASMSLKLLIEQMREQVQNLE